MRAVLVVDGLGGQPGPKVVLSGLGHQVVRRRDGQAHALHLDGERENLAQARHGHARLVVGALHQLHQRDVHGGGHGNAQARVEQRLARLGVQLDLALLVQLGPVDVQRGQVVNERQEHNGRLVLVLAQAVARRGRRRSDLHHLLLLAAGLLAQALNGAPQEGVGVPAVLPQALSHGLVVDGVDVRIVRQDVGAVGVNVLIQRLHVLVHAGVALDVLARPKQHAGVLHQAPRNVQHKQGHSKVLEKEPQLLQREAQVLVVVGLPRVEHVLVQPGRRHLHVCVAALLAPRLHLGLVLGKAGAERADHKLVAAARLWRQHQLHHLAVLLAAALRGQVLSDLCHNPVLQARGGGVGQGLQKGAVHHAGLAVVLDGQGVIGGRAGVGHGVAELDGAQARGKGLQRRRQRAVGVLAHR